MHTPNRSQAGGPRYHESAVGHTVLPSVSFDCFEAAVHFGEAIDRKLLGA